MSMIKLEEGKMENSPDSPEIATDPISEEPQGPPGVSMSPFRWNRLTLIVGIVVVAAVVGLVALNSFGSSSDGPKNDLQVSMSVSHTSLGYKAGDACDGLDGYDDIREGASVVVYDGAGKVIGTSSLGAGTMGNYNCAFTATVAGLPKADFYAVEVSHRGKSTSSYAELEANGWQMALTLG